MSPTAATAATTLAPMSVAPEAYLVVAALLFAIGLAGVLLKRNALSVFLSIELMMNAVNLLFLAFARMRGDATGQMVVFFVIAVAAAEAAVGLAIFVALFRSRRTIDLDKINLLKW